MVNNKQTIIYLISTLRNSGPVNQTYNLIKNLDRTQFNPVIITLSKEPADSKIQLFKALDISIHTINFSRIKGIFLLKNAIQKIIENYNNPIIHSQGLRADSLNYQLKKYPMKITTIHNFPFDDYVMKFGAIKGFIMSVSHLTIIKKIKNRIACSEAISTLFNTKLHCKLGFINNSVDTDFFQTSNDTEKIALRKQYNLPIDAKIFIYTGQIIKRKDLETLISGFKKFNKPNALLLIIGDGSYFPIISQLKNDSIILTGKTRSVLDYLKLSDVFISASLSEGLPNSVLEAMSCNLPCLLSDIDAHMCLITESVLLFKTGSHEDLCQKLIQIDAFKHSDNRKFVIDNFSIQKMTDSYQKLYTNIQEKT